jgi:hypothetical protein
MRSILILIEGDGITRESLGISLRNAKQLVLGRAPDYGHVVHIAAESASDLEAALHDFAEIENVSGVICLATRVTH